MSRTAGAPDVIDVRALEAADLDAADMTMRVAFGTFIGVPEPERFMGDAQYVRTRWTANPEAAFAATIGQQLVGSNFATAWGSVGFFGPLTTHPSVWDKGVGRRLIEPAMAYLRASGVRHTGLFTFSNSAKHLALYQRFGFWPRHLTLLLTKDVTSNGCDGGYTCLSHAPAESRTNLISECTCVTDALYEGLDVSGEIRATADQCLGDTIILAGGDRVDGFAVCHAGANTEAGSGVCYVKFAAARPGPNGARHFARLMDACCEFAREAGAGRIVAGVNTACTEASQFLLSEGFRINMSGISMHAPNESAYYRPGVYACSDWR